MAASTHTTDEEIFGAIAEERRRMAATLDELNSVQWEAPSLCVGWSVRDVAAHLVMPLVTPMWRMGAAMTLALGNFDRANVRLTDRVAQRHGQHLPELLRRHADGRFTPPGMGPLAPLTDIVVHSFDIREALGIVDDAPEVTRRTVLDFMATTENDLFPPPKADIRWQATDMDWEYGTGKLVAAPARSILMILTERSAGFDEADGPGVGALQRAPR